MKTFNPNSTTTLHSMNQTILPALRRLLPLLLLLLALPAARGQTVPPPGTMSFQGYLTDQSGMPLGAASTGPKNYTVVFRIFDAASAGNELHGEQQTVTVNNGYFSILLGQGTPYSPEPNVGNNLASLFTGPTAASRYVEMMVVGIGASGNNVTIAPRLKLVSSPYAYLAANAVSAANASSLVNTNNNNTVVVTVATNGNVGIGTSTPTQPLQVNGSAEVDGPLYIATASQPVLNFWETTHNYSASLVEVSNNGWWNNAALAGDLVLRNLSGKLLFAYGTANAGLTIDTQNHVGIGTTTPAGSLEVDGNLNSSPLLTLNQNIASWGTGTIYSNYRFIQTTTAQTFTDGPFRQFNVAPGGVSIGYSTTPPYGSGNALYVNGFEGIGTTNPAAPLEVDGTDTKVIIRNLNDSVGAFIGETYGTLQLGINNSSGATVGAVAAGSSSSFFGMNASGKVGSLWNTYGTPNFRNILDDGSGNASVQGAAQFSGPVQICSYVSIGTNANTGLYADASNIALRGTTSGGIFFQNTGGQKTYMWMGGSSGYVGIGTTNPNYPLDVEANVAKTISGYSSLYETSGGFPNGWNTAYSGGNSGSADTISIYANSIIACNRAFFCVSDARVKEVVGRSDTSKDLATVRKIQITDYRKVDKVQFGGRLEKGVIAQEVERLIPEAVNTSTNFIPNIYAPAKAFACTNETMLVTTAQPHGLVVGDVVKLFTDTDELKVPVTAVQSPQQFTVAQSAVQSKHLFVFGKQVGDFREVNYDRLFTTGLGAIQELAKRADAADARAERLTQRVEELAAEKKNVAELERKAAQVDELSRQVAELKKLVAQLAQPNAAHTTARTAADASANVAATSR